MTGTRIHPFSLPIKILGLVRARVCHPQRRDSPSARTRLQRDHPQRWRVSEPVQEPVHLGARPERREPRPLDGRGGSRPDRPATRSGAHHRPLQSRLAALPGTYLVGVSYLSNHDEWLIIKPATAGARSAEQVTFWPAATRSSTAGSTCREAGTRDVDTGVVLNVGDQWALTGAGTIWAGFLGTGLNGPEGWTDRTEATRIPASRHARVASVRACRPPGHGLTVLLHRKGLRAHAVRRHRQPEGASQGQRRCACERQRDVSLPRSSVALIARCWQCCAQTHLPCSFKFLIMEMPLCLN